RSATRAMCVLHIARVAQMVGHSHECEATLETKEHLSTPLNWRHYTIERETITSGRLSRPVALVGQPAWMGISNPVERNPAPGAGDRIRLNSGAPWGVRTPLVGSEWS